MTGSSGTRLSRLHAYPAMVEDGLAVELAQRYVTTGSRVLDPFCGSGRLLVAGAASPGQFLGIDVNPLACLVARAKTVRVSGTTMTHIISDLRFAKSRHGYQDICWRERRKVDWYSDAAKHELSQIVGWINSLDLDEAEKIVAAVALSRAARNASYCRNGRWKLHRMTKMQRATYTCSAWEAFGKALQYYVDATCSRSPLMGRIDIVCGQAEKGTRS